jgi:hypothetical protein
VAVPLAIVGDKTRIVPQYCGQFSLMKGSPHGS